VGDSNFGIFSVAYAADQRGRPVVLRLTAVRAESLAGDPYRTEPIGESSGDLLPRIAAVIPNFPGMAVSRGV